MAYKDPYQKKKGQDEEKWKLRNKKIQPFWLTCKITQKQPSLKKYHARERVKAGE